MKNRNTNRNTDTLLKEAYLKDLIQLLRGGERIPARGIKERGDLLGRGFYSCHLFGTICQTRPEKEICRVCWGMWRRRGNWALILPFKTRSHRRGGE